HAEELVRRDAEVGGLRGRMAELEAQLNNARGATLHSVSATHQLDGIGVIRTVTIRYDGEIGRVPTARYECIVDFHGLKPGAKASPSELLLTDTQGRRIVTLEATSVVEGAGTVTYANTGPWTDLMNRID